MGCTAAIDIKHLYWRGVLFCVVLNEVLARRRHLDARIVEVELESLHELSGWMAH